MPSRETPGSDFEEDLRKAMAAEASDLLTLDVSEHRFDASSGSRVANPRKIGHTDDPHASAFADSPTAGVFGG